VLKSIEALRPGLYAMEIHERKDADGRVSYDVDFIERDLAEIKARLNKFERADERPFEAVNVISEFNQRAYELFAQPLVQSSSNEYVAKLGRQFHPLRFQRWAFSDINPWLAWLGPAAEAVRAQRRPASEDNVMTKAERATSKAISATLEYCRAMRDATSEAMFFQMYGNVFSLYLADKREAEAKAAPPIVEARELPFVAEALASIDRGGYPEALARVAAMLARSGEPLPLSSLQLKQELMADYADLLPKMPADQWRRIRGEQEIIVRYEPEQALATLPKLLADPADRQKLVTLVRKLLADERIHAKPSTQQLSMVEHVGEALHVSDAARVHELPEGAPRPKAAGARRNTKAKG
jgi:hypothetical protein